MKKTVLSTLLLSLSVSMVTAQAAMSDADIKAQLDSQKQLITDNKFYPATTVFYTNVGIFVPTFKEQLDSQKEEVTDYTFYPAASVSYKKNVVVAKPSFKKQLDSQKEMLKDYKFYPANNVVYTNDGVMVPSFEATVGWSKRSDKRLQVLSRSQCTLY
ncbi:MAG: hypothetical protein Q9N32_04665 [Gammaproteobacteria bacterium]|nr:hypothetical protein [Gammaproteobacteria bacterium]